MNHEEALTRALALAITAPDNRIEQADKLVQDLAMLCTSAEIEKAKRNVNDYL
tara:strand:+ start:2030 stop:2188 length:159 start_codon:yes stop_codon:yes gene_type:complete